MFAEEAGPGRAALHAPVDWLHQVWPAVLLAWPRAVGAVQLGKVQCDELDALGTFTSLERRQTNDCSICCFRCHLFLCVYLAFCLVKLPKASEPSRSLGNGGCEWKRCRVLLSLSTPGNSLSQAEPGRARPSKPDQGQSPAVIEDTVRTS
ncbi:hypothetical protein JOB18_030964 [Solea senegalensis]|uniref:Uncharacterized protein n=1 Tax=Solea senegalensis TaxID=28829 RepID=A0AAV6QM21_SOLSE|nr:hypothetical protein JOB18_030964 [Solea senegalensis]